MKSNERIIAEYKKEYLELLKSGQPPQKKLDKIFSEALNKARVEGGKELVKLPDNCFQCGGRLNIWNGSHACVRIQKLEITDKKDNAGKVIVEFPVKYICTRCWDNQALAEIEKLKAELNKTQLDRNKLAQINIGDFNRNKKQIRKLEEELAELYERIKKLKKELKREFEDCKIKLQDASEEREEDMYGYLMDGIKLAQELIDEIFPERKEK